MCVCILVVVVIAENDEYTDNDRRVSANRNIANIERKKESVLLDLPESFDG